MRLSAILAVLVVFASTGLVAEASWQAATYEVSFQGSGSGENCNGSWNVTGTVTVNLTIDNGVATAIVDGRLRYELEPDTSQLAMCVEILLSREGVAPGYKIRFPANATYPKAPIYYTHNGPVAYTTDRVEAEATPGDGVLASNARVVFHGAQSEYNLTLKLVSETTRGVKDTTMGGEKARPNNGLSSPLTLAAILVMLLTLSVAVLRHRRVL